MQRTMIQIVEQVGGSPPEQAQEEEAEYITPFSVSRVRDMEEQGSVPTVPFFGSPPTFTDLLAGIVFVGM